MERVASPADWKQFLAIVQGAGFVPKSGRLLDASYVTYLKGRQLGLSPSQLTGPVGRWVFMSHITGRYRGAGERGGQVDASIFDSVETGRGFLDTVERTISAEAPADFWTTTLEDRLDGRSSSALRLCYQAALVVLDAQLLFSNAKIRHHISSSGGGKTLDTHHLFPKKFLASLGVTDRQQDLFANRALADRSENRRAEARPPREYWPEMTDHLTASQCEDQMRWHALPDRWWEMDYREFVPARRVLLAEIIHEGFTAIGT